MSSADNSSSTPSIATYGNTLTLDETLQHIVTIRSALAQLTYTADAHEHEAYQLRSLAHDHYLRAKQAEENATRLSDEVELARQAVNRLLDHLLPTRVLDSSDEEKLPIPIQSPPEPLPSHHGRRRLLVKVDDNTKMYLVNPEGTTTPPSAPEPGPSKSRHRRNKNKKRNTLRVSKREAQKNPNSHTPWRTRNPPSNDTPIPIRAPTPYPSHTKHVSSGDDEYFDFDDAAEGNMADEPYGDY